MEEKKKNTLYIAISALVLLPISLLTVYASMAFSLRTIDIFGYGGGVVNVFVPVLFAIYLLMLTMMVYILYGIKGGNITCGFLRAEGVIFTTMVFALILNSFMVEWLSSFASPLVMVMLFIGILIKPKVGLVSCLTSAMAAIILTTPLSYLITPSQFSLSGMLGTVDAFVSAFFMSFLLRGKKFTRFSLTWGTLAISVVTSLIGGLLALMDSWDFQSMLNGYFSSVIGNVVAVCIFTTILPIYESVSRIWTDFKLAELCSLNQPVLKKMSEDAPGTFSHALTVAN
ncbi:MAG: hypothetical protein K2I79_02890, partial [Clostridia bacterium]|nr:hypothetical protein [Clostridia bacterium]